MQRASYERVRCGRRAVFLLGASLALVNACRLGSETEPPFKSATGGQTGGVGGAHAGSGGSADGDSEVDSGTAGQSASGGANGNAGADASGTGGSLGTGGSAAGSGGSLDSGVVGGSGGTSDASDAPLDPDASDASTDSGGADSGGANDAGCPPSWVVTYRLDGDPPPGPPAPFDRTVFAIRSAGVSVNVGDHTDTGWECTGGGQDCLGVGPGRLKIRYRDAGGQPGDGKVTLAAYENAYVFRLSFVDSFLSVDADGVLPASPPSTLQPNHPAPVCEAAVGALSGRRVTWTTPTVDHRTHGTIVCNTTQAFCSLGGLNAGTNTRDDTYAVLFKPFILTLAPAAGTSGEFYLDEGANPQPESTGIEIPTPNPSVQGRAFIVLKGAEINRQLEPSPACFCQ